MKKGRLGEAGMSPAMKEEDWGQTMHILGMSEVELEKIFQYFKRFDVQGIEVWVVGVTKAGVFVVSLEASAGVKIILKPKKLTQGKSQ